MEPDTSTQAMGALVGRFDAHRDQDVVPGHSFSTPLDSCGPWVDTSGKRRVADSSDRKTYRNQQPFTDSVYY